MAHTALGISDYSQYVKSILCTLLDSNNKQIKIYPNKTEKSMTFNIRKECSQ